MSGFERSSGRRVDKETSVEAFVSFPLLSSRQERRSCESGKRRREEQRSEKAEREREQERVFFFFFSPLQRLPRPRASTPAMSHRKFERTSVIDGSSESSCEAERDQSKRARLLAQGSELIEESPPLHRSKQAAVVVVVSVIIFRACSPPPLSAPRFGLSTPERLRACSFSPIAIGIGPRRRAEQASEKERNDARDR